jgi:anti-sigma regulatory factor (Ser/Thr protein kinase)
VSATPAGHNEGTRRATERTPTVPEPSRRPVIRLPPEPWSVAAARGFAAGLCRQWHVRAVDNVTILVGETVTNAVVHAGTNLAVLLYLIDGGQLHGEVIDHSDQWPNHDGPDVRAQGGYGLRLVDALAGDWGVESRVGGKAVWFKVGQQPHPHPVPVPRLPR